MRTSKAKLLLGAASLAALFSTAASADVLGGSLSGSLAVTSDYRFRGISNNDRKPAFQPSINWSGPDGFYVGTWGSMVDFDDHADTSIEWDIYGGKHFDLGNDTDLNIEPYYYAYPNHNSKKAGFDDSYFELIVQLSHKFGDLSLMATGAWSPEFFGETGTGWYIAGNATYSVNDWLSLSGNVGHQWVKDIDPLHVGFPYTHWDLGATATWNNFALDARYVDTSISKSQCATFNGAGNGDWCTATAVVTLTYNIGGGD